MAEDKDDWGIDDPESRIAYRSGVPISRTEWPDFRTMAMGGRRYYLLSQNEFDALRAGRTTASNLFLTRKRRLDLGEEEAASPLRDESETSNQDRLTARHTMLLSLLGEHVQDKLASLFPSNVGLCTFKLKFDVIGSPTMGDYASFLSTVDRLYRFLATFAVPTYFMQRWLDGAVPDYKREHLLLPRSITKNSPGEIEGSGATIVANALGEALTIGKQIQEIGMTGTKIADAKLAYERKKLEFEELRREVEQKKALSPLDMDVERAKRELELKKLQTEILVEESKQRKLLLEEMDERFASAARRFAVINQLPKELQTDVRIGLTSELERLGRLPFLVKDLSVRDADKPATRKSEDPGKG